jgi:hypothetical protein
VFGDKKPVEYYVESFPQASSKWQVSTDGGMADREVHDIRPPITVVLNWAAGLGK